MDNEERIRRLKERFATVFPYPISKLTITHRKVKGEQRTYFKATGCYRREAMLIIQEYFPNAYCTSRDHAKNIFKFKDE